MKPAVLLAACAALLLGGCASADAGNAADGGRMPVSAAFYPLQFVAQRVAGRHAEVVDLTQPGAEPHDLELTPKAVGSLAQAKVVVYLSGFQPAVDQAVRSQARDAGVDVAPAARLTGRDPHFWLDPTLLARVAQAFTTSIAESDTEHAADYRAANERLQADLSDLDGEFRAGLKDCRSRTLVVSHDAFGYLASRYDLQVQPIAGLSPGAEPSPRHLAELSDLIRTDAITTVFTERLASPKLADTLASDLGIKTAVLDPIEGLTSSDADDDYLSLMKSNLAAVEKAGGCP